MIEKLQLDWNFKARRKTKFKFNLHSQLNKLNLHTGLKWDIYAKVIDFFVVVVAFGKVLTLQYIIIIIIKMINNMIYNNVNVNDG